MFNWLKKKPLDSTKEIRNELYTSYLVYIEELEEETEKQLNSHIDGRLDTLHYLPFHTPEVKEYKKRYSDLESTLRVISEEKELINYYREEYPHQCFKSNREINSLLETYKVLIALPEIFSIKLSQESTNILSSNLREIHKEIQDKDKKYYRYIGAEKRESDFEEYQLFRNIPRYCTGCCKEDVDCRVLAPLGLTLVPDSYEKEGKELQSDGYFILFPVRGGWFVVQYVQCPQT